MNEHVVFFDGECPLCHRAVSHIAEIDLDQKFLFAPLEGKTADAILIGPQKHLRKADSLVLVVDYQSTERSFWIRSRAILRVYWLVGHGWALIGILSFLPGWVGDLFYKQIARHRHKFKLKIPEVPAPIDRFLP